MTTDNKGRGKGKKPKTKKLRNPVSPNTKRLAVVDPVSEKGGHNICTRVDAETHQALLGLMRRDNYKSKSALASQALREFLHAFRTEKDPMSLLEMQHYGTKRGQNVSDKDGGQWQAHDPEVVIAVKMLEQTHNLSRKVIGRAALARFIAMHEDAMAAED